MIVFKNSVKNAQKLEKSVMHESLVHKSIWRNDPMIPKHYSVLEIIFLYSQDISPLKSFYFWPDILQIGPDIIYLIYWLTTPWGGNSRCAGEMCGHPVIVMWSWLDIFKIWSDNVWWLTVISSTVTVKSISETMLVSCLFSLFLFLFSNGANFSSSYHLFLVYRQDMKTWRRKS